MKANEKLFYDDKFKYDCEYHIDYYALLYGGTDNLLQKINTVNTDSIYEIAITDKLKKVIKL